MVVSSLVIQQINAAMEKVLVTLMMIVMEIWFVEKITALLGIAVIVVVAIQKTLTGLAALPPIHATLERDTVSRITSVLEIWFVDIETAICPVAMPSNIAWIAVPPLPAPHLLLAWSSSGWGTTQWWTAATGHRGFQCQVSLSKCDCTYRYLQHSDLNSQSRSNFFFCKKKGV